MLHWPTEPALAAQLAFTAASMAWVSVMPALLHFHWPNAHCR